MKFPREKFVKLANRGSMPNFYRNMFLFDAKKIWGEELAALRKNAEELELHEGACDGRLTLLEKADVFALLDE